MDQERFIRGRHSPQEGGPKGLDIEASSGILAVTCKSLPLAFFDTRAMLDVGGLDADERALELEHELMLMERIECDKAVLDGWLQSKSWRVTAPLRSLGSLWRGSPRSVE
jgi:hypothetical protein